MTKAKKQREESEEEVTKSESKVTEIPVRDGESDQTDQTDQTDKIDESSVPEVEEEEEEIDPLVQLQTRVAELEDQKLLILADADNHRKRLVRQHETVAQAATDRLLSELLDVIDNMERALEHSNGDNGENGDDDSSEAAWQVGSVLILQQMLDLLARHKVRAMAAVGSPFDAAYHEALMQVASDEYDEGIVVSEIRKGYMIADRVLRHARVAVSQPPADDKPPTME